MPGIRNYKSRITTSSDYKDKSARSNSITSKGYDNGLVKGYVVEVGSAVYNYQPRMLDTPYYQYRVRIPCYHRNKTYTADEDLPWAIALSSFAEAPLTGSSKVDPASEYAEGDVVYIIFEGGDIRYPIIVGTLWERASSEDPNYTTKTRGSLPLPSETTAFYNKRGSTYSPRGSVSDPANNSAAGASGSNDPAELYDQINSYDDYKLGQIVMKYESGGDSTVIGDNAGDYGGKSYGRFQLASNVGALDDFLKWLKKKDPARYKELYDALEKDGGDPFHPGDNFDEAWRRVAADSGFSDLEYQYMLSIYFYGPAQKYLTDTGEDITSHSAAIWEAFLSRCVANGVNGGPNIFKNVVDWSKSDREILEDLYKYMIDNVDRYWSKCSEDIRRSVRNRLEREYQDILALYERYPSNNSNYVYQTN